MAATTTGREDCRACGRTVYRYEDEPMRDTCSHMCELHTRGFGHLELRREQSGWRHYLHGEPVACGTGLQLAPVRVPSQEDLERDGWKEWEAKDMRKRLLAEREGKVIPCRYESPLAQPKEPPALLYVDVVGHSAVITAYGDTQVRWPPKAW